MAEGRGGRRDQTLVIFELCTRNEVSISAEHVPVMNHTNAHAFGTATGPLSEILVSCPLLPPAQ